MAVAAAETNRALVEQIDIDREFSRLILANGFSYDPERPPESEVYGRSLSTIHRLGKFMMHNSLHEAVKSPEADQARVEFFTSVEEGFGTDMELGGGLEVRDFDERPIIDGRVMAKDRKTAISSMTEAGLRCAEETAKKDQNFLPQLVRSKWDHHNALLVDAMARGETSYNTLIVVSPFPEEAAVRSGNAYWQKIGYVPKLKRGFAQLYHVQDNKLLAGSLSFDGSDKKHLQKVFQQLDVKIPDDEITDNWLKYPITSSLSSEEAKALVTEIANKAGALKPKKTTNTVDVTREYKKIMDYTFDSSYVHVCESLARGYQTEATASLVQQLANEAHHFNPRYKKALYGMRADRQRFTDDDSAVLHELLVYSTIEMMRALHIKKTRGFQDTIMTNDVQLMLASPRYASPAAFQSMLGGFGAIGAMHGRVYSACGLEISAGSSNGRGPQSAFGGVDGATEESYDPNEDEHGPLDFQCKNGHWNRRPRHRLLTECKIKGCKNSVGC